MPSAHVARWRAAYDIEPWGERRSDIHTALICHALAGVAGVRLPPMTLDEAVKRFVADWWKPTPATPEEHTAALAARFAAAFGGDPGATEGGGG